MKRVLVIGAGLAGSEAAWQCARRGVAVELFEMRPARTTPAHQTDDFAELVCSNSLKSESENTAPWLLKEEMRRAGSLLLEIARDTAVPAGHALAVDRAEFSRKVTEAISREPLITIRREEVTQVAAGQLTVDRNRSADVGCSLAGNCAVEFCFRPKEAFEFEDATASLERCPDTKPSPQTLRGRGRPRHTTTCIFTIRSAPSSRPIPST